MDVYVSSLGDHRITFSNSNNARRKIDPTEKGLDVTKTRNAKNEC
jgi:hypothetical protein